MYISTYFSLAVLLKKTITKHICIPRKKIVHTHLYSHICSGSFIFYTYVGITNFVCYFSYIYIHPHRQLYMHMCMYLTDTCIHTYACVCVLHVHTSTSTHMYTPMQMLEIARNTHMHTIFHAHTYTLSFFLYSRCSRSQKMR